MKTKFALPPLFFIVFNTIGLIVNAQCPDVICTQYNITSIKPNSIGISFEIKNIGTDTLFLKKTVIQHYVTHDSAFTNLYAAGGAIMSGNAKDCLLPGQTYQMSYGASKQSIDTFKYVVSLFYYTGKNECSADNSTIIARSKLSEAIDAKCSADVITGIVPLALQFTDQSTGTPTAWKWDFNNDGTVDATTQNPSYTYQTPGTYTVKLIASKPGMADTIIKTNYIVAAPIVDAQFTSNVTSGSAPLTVRFSDLSTGTATSWSWDFNNDGTVDATSQNPSFTYQTAGTYTVTLIASKTGSTDNLVKTGYIVVNNPSTGTEEIKEESIKVYPNPSNGRIVINFGEKLQNQNIAIEIYDNNGKIIFSKKIENCTSFEHDFAGYNAGTYIIKAISDKKVFLKRVIIR